jgi:hypothetical protein
MRNAFWDVTRVAVVRLDLSEEHTASIFRITGLFLLPSSKRRCASGYGEERLLQRQRRLLLEPHSSQRTPDPRWGHIGVHHFVSSGVRVCQHSPQHPSVSAAPLPRETGFDARTQQPLTHVTPQNVSSAGLCLQLERHIAVCSI